MTKVVNIKKDKYDVYCGRPGHGQDGYFGNPFIIGEDGTREEVIEKFKTYFRTRLYDDIEFKNKVLSLKDKTLGCFCKPLACHCDIIKEYLDNLIMDNKFVTGVGSRETPLEIISLIKDVLSVRLSNQGYRLRSGGADGADMAFEQGWGESKEIYLPWKGFNNNPSQLYNVSKEALELASTIHPAWSRLSFGAKKLHARNCYQVLGQDLNKPSNLLICWTKNGVDIGGTRTAIVLARKYNIPIYNLAIPKDIENLTNFLNGHTKP